MCVTLCASGNSDSFVSGDCKFGFVKMRNVTEERMCVRVCVCVCVCVVRCARVVIVIHLYLGIAYLDLFRRITYVRIMMFVRVCVLCVWVCVRGWICACELVGE